MADFSMFIIFMLIAGFTVLGISAWTDYSRREHAAAVGARWQRAGRTVHAAPVPAGFFTNEPRRGNRYHHSPEAGALGVVDDRLAFEARGAWLDEIPLAGVRWIGSGIAIIPRGKTSERLTTLVVHFEASDGERLPLWYRAVFSVKPAELTTLGQTLSQRTGLRFHYQGREREDYGPSPALRMAQDMHGRWYQVWQGEAYQGDDGDAYDLDRDLTRLLYLAPDRLLFNRREAIPLAAMRRIDVYQKGTLAVLNPFSEDLLRIEYTHLGTHQVASFLVRNAPAWGRAIGEARPTIAVEFHTGRKKK